MLFRVVLLLAIAGGLAVFTLSNLQPIALVFLGIQTPALPLSWWVLGAIGAGALTTVTISVLISLSNYATGRKVRSRFRQATQGGRFQGFSRSPFQGSSTSASATARTGSKTGSAADDDSAWKNWDEYEDKTAAQSSATKPNPVDGDWNTDIEDDWETPGMGKTPSGTPEDRFRADATRQQTADATAADSQASSRADSAYSYGYKDPKSSGAGRRETVVDAEYRVIVPPYRSPEPPPPPPPTPTPVEENADDWFEDDDAGSGDRNWQR